MTTLGAVRLPNFNGTSTAAPTRRDCNLYWNSWAAYKTQAPTYLSLSGDILTGRSDTQGVADLQIQQAAACGIDYFAFDFTGGEADFFSPGIGYTDVYREFADEFNSELTLHRSSAYKSMVKFCVVLNSWYQLLPVASTDSSFDTYVAPYLVSMFQDPAHMTVLGGRPLMYFFNPIFPGPGEAAYAVFSNNAACGAAMSDLRDRCAAATSPTVGDPYIVLLSGPPTDHSSLIAPCGFDAGGLYGVTPPSTGQSAAAFLASVESTWPNMTTWYGTAQVPVCMTGYDHERLTANHGAGKARDRSGNHTVYSDPTKGYPDGPYVSSLPPSAQQWADHVSAGTARAAAHSAADTLLLNAWIEQDVCPPLGPTWGHVQYLQMQAKALGRQREHRSILRARGIGFSSR